MFAEQQHVKRKGRDCAMRYRHRIGWRALTSRSPEEIASLTRQLRCTCNRRWGSSGAAPGFRSPCVGNRTAELGLSVIPTAPNRGIGLPLLWVRRSDRQREPPAAHAMPAGVRRAPPRGAPWDGADAGST
jgi:hypothetical protein